MRDHRKLTAFQSANRLVLATYEVTREFPAEATFGLTRQFRRAAVSVPATIVEGCGRRSEVEFARFLRIAFGSLREVE